MMRLRGRRRLEAVGGGEADSESLWSAGQRVFLSLGWRRNRSDSGAALTSALLLVCREKTT